MTKFAGCEKDKPKIKAKINSAEQKRFIVKAFGSNPSPTSERREFLFHIMITRRDASKINSHLFSNVNTIFEQNDNRTKRTAGCEPSKRSPEKISNLYFTERNNIVEESSTPARCFFTLFRIMKLDLKHDFVSCQIRPAID